MSTTQFASQWWKNAQDLQAHIADELQVAGYTSEEERIMASSWVECCFSEHHSGLWWLGKVKDIVLTTPTQFDVECYRCRAIHRVSQCHITEVMEKK